MCNPLASLELTLSTKTDESVTHFFNQLRQVDDEAAERLLEHFWPRMLGRARATLAGRPQRVADAEDVAQSALKSFWKWAKHGQHEGELHRDDLWRVAVTITLRKAWKQGRWARPRGLPDRWEINETGILASDGSQFRIDEVFEHVPVGDFDMACEELLDQLNDEPMRRIALFKLDGHTNREISEIEDCSLSTVERNLRLIRKTWTEKNKIEDSA